MTIKFIIPYHQWMQYGKDKCRGWRKNEDGDIYFVVDFPFLIYVSRLPDPDASLLDIVNEMKDNDNDDTASGDVSLYFDYESRHLFHDRKLKDRAIILNLTPTASIYEKLRDRICSFTDAVAILPNVLLIEHCGTNGHIALLGKVKRIAELLMVEENCNEYMTNIIVEKDRFVCFALSPFHFPIARID